MPTLESEPDDEARFDPSPDVSMVLTEDARQRVNAIRDREMAILVADPAFKAYLLRGLDRVTTEQEAYERGRVLGAILTRRGIPRLDDASLRLWSDTRYELAKTSLEVCVGLATGQVAPDALDWALAQLPEERLADSMRMAADAGLAELAAQAPLQPDPQAMSAGLEGLVGDLPEADRARFFAAIRGELEDPEDQCFAVKVLHGRVDVLDEALRARFLRALAVLFAQ